MVLWTLKNYGRNAMLGRFSGWPVTRANCVALYKENTSRFCQFTGERKEGRKDYIEYQPLNEDGETCGGGIWREVKVHKMTPQQMSGAYLQQIISCMDSPACPRLSSRIARPHFSTMMAR